MFRKLIIILAIPSFLIAGTGVHTTYLWHMHQPIYWPAESNWNSGRYETAYETISSGHSQNNVHDIFDKDDRVGDYQWYPKDAVSSISDLPEAGAQLSFAGALIENINSLGDSGWMGGRYSWDWYNHTRTARSWLNSAGKPRMEPVVVGFHHAIGPLMDETAFIKELACAIVIYDDTWGAGEISKGFFPAEMCFSERLIPALVDAGIEWSIVPDLHIARACENYPYSGYQDNCDPPNRADQINPAQSQFTNHFISRGVTLKVPYPYGFTPHRAEYINPETGISTNLIVVPAANAMGWDEGYGLFGTGPINDITDANNPDHPMLVLFAHDGDNAWSGGNSYYYENVTQFSHNAANSGYTPTTVSTYLEHHPVPADDIVHVEDGGWVNADGDFGSPQYINWNWPPVNQSGQFDIPNGWAEDERNWAVLTATQNIVETAEQTGGSADPEKIVYPQSGANDVERAWHFLLAGYESGYMYYGNSLDMEIKASIACNKAIEFALPIASSGADLTSPTIWLPQRLPWNPGGMGGGSLWGYPGGDGEQMDSDFHVWTYAFDHSGLSRVELMVREDIDGVNGTSNHNETYSGGSDVNSWTTHTMNFSEMPLGEPWEIDGIDFTVLPHIIANKYWFELTDYEEVLLDYYIEAEDMHGNIKRSPIQHVWVGESSDGSSSGFNMDGELDDAQVVANSSNLTLAVVRDENQLYLSTTGVGQTDNMDHFILISDGSETATSAPWAKAGTVPQWDYYLASENDNNWCGWFDSNENLQTFECASGSVLEGVIDLESIYGMDIPDIFWIATLAYSNEDGGDLLDQAPVGNGDGDVTFNELFLLSSVSDVSEPMQLAKISLHPNPFNPEVIIKITLHEPENIKLNIYDALGRLVNTLNHSASSPGGALIHWNGRDHTGANCPSGVYIFKTNNGLTIRGTLIK